ncbi:MAG: TlyA family RNA methyltransferase [Pseudomonadota bacterium]
MVGRRAGAGQREAADDAAGTLPSAGAAPTGRPAAPGAAASPDPAAAPGRLDRRLVALGLADSRARAQRLVAEGAVTVDGRPARRPAESVAPGAEIRVEAADPAAAWVSRGALKLLHALDRFGLAPSGHALDLGASTGGFTEVLLARGAARVTALDVGRDQLHLRLAADPRVTRLDGTNARAIPPGLVAPYDWLTADLAFVSLLKALPAPLALARPGATAVLLVKPQFEVGRQGVGRGGIVRDPALRARALDRVTAFIAGAGWTPIGQCESPIQGGDGNTEFLLAARLAPAAGDTTP